MARIQTGVVDLFTASTTEALIPMTGPINSTDVKSVKISAELIAATTGTTFQGRPGFQYSDDGIVWGSPNGININSGATYCTAGQWNFGDTYTDLYSGYSPKLFIRFGMMCSNLSGSSTQSACARLRIDIAPQRQGTFVAPPTKVITDSTSHTFYPLGPAIPSEMVGEIRATLDAMAVSNDVTVVPAWQEGSNPRLYTGDGWGSATEFGSSRSTVGVTYGTTFSSVSLTKEFIRFGLVAYSGGTNVNAALAALRIDYRKL